MKSLRKRYMENSCHMIGPNHHQAILGKGLGTEGLYTFCIGLSKILFALNPKILRCGHSQKLCFFDLAIHLLLLKIIYDAVLLNLTMALPFAFRLTGKLFFCARYFLLLGPAPIFEKK